MIDYHLRLGSLGNFASRVEDFCAHRLEVFFLVRFVLFKVYGKVGLSVDLKFRF